MSKIVELEFDNLDLDFGFFLLIMVFGKSICFRVNWEL